MVKSAVTLTLPPAAGQSAENSKTRNPEVRIPLIFFLLYFLYLKNEIGNKSINKRLTFIENIFVPGIYYTKPSHIIISFNLHNNPKRQVPFILHPTNEKTGAHRECVTFRRSPK